jgi:uncharacterized glyoxalase superfamily protein PhnB
MAATETIEWPPSVTPYIAVRDGGKAIEWYTTVLDARPRGEPYVMEDGSLGHAELAIGDGVLMLAEGSDVVPVQPPDQPKTHSHSIHVQVDDVDATIRRARAGGAQIEREPVDEPYGRVAVFIDPFGHRWLTNQPPGHASRQRDGDVGYITMLLPDPERAREFYGAVLGWAYSAGDAPDVRPMLGIGSGGPEVQLCYRVADIAAALEVVSKHGGTAGPVEDKPYGQLAECADNQGMRFHLWETAD